MTKRMPDYLTKPDQAVPLKRNALPDQGTRPFKFEIFLKRRARSGRTGGDAGRRHLDADDSGDD